jgi:hypothetical protein
MLIYADDVNVLGGNINTIKKTIETGTDVSKEDGLQVNVSKAKSMLPSRHQNARNSYVIET